MSKDLKREMQYLVNLEVPDFFIRDISENIPRFYVVNEQTRSGDKGANNYRFYTVIFIDNEPKKLELKFVFPFDESIAVQWLPVLNSAPTFDKQTEEQKVNKDIRLPF